MIEVVPQEEQRRLLAKVDILEPLPPEEVERIASLSSTVPLMEGEAVHLDRNSHALYLLTSGLVRVHEPGAGGQDLTISIIEAGAVIGQSGFATGLSRTLRVEAIQASILRVLGWDAFESLLYCHPGVAVKAIRLLSERLAVCEARLLAMVRKEVPARLAGLILELSEHQGVVTGDTSRKIPTRYTHRQLASMVGSNREAVTRAIGRLGRAGAVQIRDRHIHVTDVEALERIAESER